MGTTSTGIAIAYLALVVLGLGLAVLLYRTTRARRAVDPEELAHREKTWLGVVVVLLIALLFSTIFFVPYWASAGPNAQRVEVEAVQFGWTITPGAVQAGTPVQFVLRSPDVNHGFGVYDENDNLVFQVQVIPGKTQRAVHTFETPGTYSILCLEFCGVGHHLMVNQLTVEPV